MKREFVLIAVGLIFLATSCKNEVISPEPTAPADPQQPPDYIIDEIEPTDVPDEIQKTNVEQIKVYEEVRISISDLRFSPEKIIVAPGTMVIWVNNDTVPHKIVEYNRIFYGPRMNPGETFSYTFTETGTYNYFDAVFRKVGRGTVVVQEEPLPVTGNAVLGGQAKNESLLG